MTREEFGLSYHEIKLELELHRRVGRSFQDLFEQIMQKHDPSFVVVKPTGRAGDWKADGFSVTNATVFQCYAPEELVAAKAAKKLVEDFGGGFALEPYVRIELTDAGETGGSSAFDTELNGIRADP